MKGIRSKVLVAGLAVCAVTGISATATAAVVVHARPADNPTSPAAVPERVQAGGGQGFRNQMENVVSLGSDTTDPVILTGTNRISDETNVSTGHIQLTYAPTDVSFCSVQATPTAPFFYAAARSSGPTHKNRIDVFVWNISDAGVETLTNNATVTVTVTC